MTGRVAMGRASTRAEIREWLGRRIADARKRGDSVEADWLLERYALVDELVTSMEILREVTP